MDKGIYTVLYKQDLDIVKQISNNPLFKEVVISSIRSEVDEVANRFNESPDSVKPMLAFELCINDSGKPDIYSNRYLDDIQDVKNWVYSFSKWVTPQDFVDELNRMSDFVDEINRMSEFLDY